MADEQTPGFTPGAMRAADFASTHAFSRQSLAEIISRETGDWELLEALERIVEQFHAYENDWLGEGVWRTRIGLPETLKTAEAAIRKARGR